MKLAIETKFATALASVCIVLMMCVVVAHGHSWGCVSALDHDGPTIWIADAHRGDRKRFVVHADEKMTAFVEAESAICSSDLLAMPCSATLVATR
jgi:hypothetical protein